MSKRWLQFVLLAGILAVATSAVADTQCTTSGSNILIPNSGSCTIYLTQSNVTQLAGVVVTVVITNSSTTANTTVSFNLTNNPLTNAALGINQIGWNGNSTYNAISSNDSFYTAANLPNLSHGGSSMDGFGVFAIQNKPGGSPNDGLGGTALIFTLAGHVTSFSANSTGNLFALQIRFGGSCSGWIGGFAGSTAPTSEVACIPRNPPPPVPEPGSMVLLGTGLIGIAGLIRRRLS